MLSADAGLAGRHAHGHLEQSAARRPAGGAQVRHGQVLQARAMLPGRPRAGAVRLVRGPAPVAGARHRTRGHWAARVRPRENRFCSLVYGVRGKCKKIEAIPTAWVRGAAAPLPLPVLRVLRSGSRGGDGCCPAPPPPVCPRPPTSCVDGRSGRSRLRRAVAGQGASSPGRQAAPGPACGPPGPPPRGRQDTCGQTGGQS